MIADQKHYFQSWSNGADASALNDGTSVGCTNNDASTFAAAAAGNPATGICMTAGNCQRNYVIIPGQGYLWDIQKEL